MLRQLRKDILIIVPIFTALAISLYLVNPPLVTEAEYSQKNSESVPMSSIQYIHKGNYILVHLDTNTLEVKNGDTILKTITLVSQGKPGSYYETIGGEYTDSYKEDLHFSTIGHVYMPYSVHIFGNYFIHGIPYYPDGTKVSSAYSGGCIRLNDNDAEFVYNFVTSSTTIILTRDNEYSFSPTTHASTTISSMNMTRLMIATISLELLTQDNPIPTTDENVLTTRRKLLPKILDEPTSNPTLIYTSTMTDEEFTQAMNDKAKALGLTNTTFTRTTAPASTTEEDYARFMGHIVTYKSYLLNGYKN